jgi:putative nucleotidyltransferase with HDIG domain
MLDDADELTFAPEEPTTAVQEGEATWKVLIADDEAGVHDVTTLALGDVQMLGRPLTFLHAYSGEETVERLREHPDTALVLLDVVMESDDAGLLAAHAIRGDLANPFVRIVLRTGQPGQAPEERVIAEYDINDYREKTELTRKKLYTTVYAAVRGYRDIVTIDRNRQGLERVIHASADLFQPQSLDHFIPGLLQQVTAIVGLDEEESFYARSAGFVAACAEPEECDTEVVLSARGDFGEAVRKPVSAIPDPVVKRRVELALERQRNLYFDEDCVVFFKSQSGHHGLVYVAGCGTLDQTQKRLLDLFCTNVSIAYSNVALQHDLHQSRRESIYTLGTVAEFHSNETGQHVVRVGKYVGQLARLMGLPREEVELLELAAPLHDIGKVGVPDRVLKKPGRLTAEEFEVMKSHARIGHEMLRASRSPLLQAASIIALTHQEKWDGSGYPDGLAGNDIHLYGRLTAVADVFDALGSKRIYKAAWPLERVVDYFREEVGYHFDPHIADLLVTHLDDFLDILRAHPDAAEPSERPPGEAPAGLLASGGFG